MSNPVLPYTCNAIFNNRLKGIGAEPVYMGVGTGAGTMTRDRTTLFTEKAGGGYARVTGTSAIETTAQTDDTYAVSATFTANASESITNVGLFDAANAGKPLMLVDFSPIPVVSPQTVAFVFRVIGK